MNTDNSIKTVRKATANKLAELKNRAETLADAKAMKNAALVLARMNKYYSKRKPCESQTANDIAKLYIDSLSRFIAAAEAPALESLSVYIDWKKSRVCGWCPTSDALISGKRYSYRAGGYGYNKLSAAVSHAMAESPSWLRFVIENARKEKAKKCYCFAWYDMPTFGFAGAGLSTLRNFLAACGWKGAGYDREHYDKQDRLCSLYYTPEA